MLVVSFLSSLSWAMRSMFMRCGQFAVALENLRRQTAFVLVDQFHQEFLFLLVDVVNFRDKSRDKRHDSLGVEKGFSFDLVIKGQNGNF